MLNLSRLLPIISLVCLVHFSSGQGFDGGIFLGMTASQVDGDGIQGFDLPGVNAGFYAKRAVGQKSSVRLELAFVQKGSRIPPSDSSNFYKLRLNYIQVPLIYEYRWKDLAFAIGLGADILVNKKEEDLFGPRETPLEYYRISMVGLFGVSYYITEQWILNVRTTNSITNISDGRRGVVSDAASYFGPYGQRNDVLSFALIYEFNN